MKKNYILIGLFIGLLGCCHFPDFGIRQELPDASNSLKNIWFSSMPSSCVMKHFVTISFSKPQPKQIDFFGYVLIKNGDFRIIAMNDLGLTMLDIFAEQKASNLIIVKAWEKLGNPDIIKQIAKDIYYIFSSQYEIVKPDLTQYTTADNSQIFVIKEDRCAWHAWETQNHRPFKIQYGRNGQEISSVRFDYSDGLIGGFPKKIAVSYPLSEVHIQIQILSLQPKEISNVQFIPTISPK
ncbi:MAG: hypothetical protein HUU50_18050 [Candidatus Brocadiae bacterium]|nr:hypothetical protein [Candidatus Brocadiia bacterium]